MDSVTIGLDIGSSAIRAAEIHVGKDGRKTLRRYGQLGLPHGYVVDGEVHNVPGVSAALKRLWESSGFSSTTVVLGVSGPRVFIRQADVPALAPEDMRSSLRFDAQELIPVPMDDASFDFSLLGPPTTGADGKATQRILLVAAHRDLLRNLLAAVKGAGLDPKVMDASSLALIRAVPVVPPAEGETGVEVIVSIGAELTTVGIRETGIPRFIRTLGIGGAKLTESIANSLHLEMAVAERLKRGAVDPDLPQLAQARKAMAPEIRDLAEEVRATIDFFLTQSGTDRVDRLLITGGASQTGGLAAAVAGGFPARVLTLDPLGALNCSSLPFSEEELNRISASGTTAIGLALWPSEAPLIRLSVLPEEILQARRARRIATLAGGSLVGLLVILGAAAATQYLQVRSAEHKVHTAQAQVARLTAEQSSLQAQTVVHNRMLSRQTLVKTALTGDVDWVRTLGQLAAVMPADLSLQSFSGSHVTATAGSASGSNSASVGTVTFSVTGTGGLPAVSSWLTGLQSDPDFTGAWVSGVQVKQNGGPVTFSSNALLTPVSQSNRAEEASQ